jgi:cell division protease FtsH
MGHQRNYSGQNAAAVDEEVKQLLATAHQEAFDILEENRDVLDALVLALIEKETLDKEEVATVFEPLRRRPVRPAWTGSPDRVPSAIPPVHVPKAAANGAAADSAPGSEPEGGLILTPPNDDGDSFGESPHPGNTP